MIWFTIIGVLLVVGSFIYLSRRADNRMSTSEPPSASAMNLESIESLRTLVVGLIDDGRLKVASLDGPSPQLLNEIGPVTRDFFSRYPIVTANNAGFRLALTDVRSSAYFPGFVAIGQSEDWEIVQRPHSDEVFIVEGAETSETELEVRFPTVYHLLWAEFGRD